MIFRFAAVAVVAVACLAGSGALAQNTTPTDTTPVSTAPTDTTPAVTAQDAAPPAAAAPAPAVVPKNTVIVIQITNLLSSKTAQIGDSFDFTLAEPVMLNGAVAIPAGTPGKGEVIDAAKPGMGGKPGKLVLAVRYLQVGDQQVPVHGFKLDMVSEDNTGTAEVVSFAVGIVGLAVTGGNMDVPAGTLAHAKLGVDFTPAAAVATLPADTLAPVTPAPDSTPAADPAPAQTTP